MCSVATYRTPHLHLPRNWGERSTQQTIERLMRSFCVTSANRLLVDLQFEGPFCANFAVNSVQSHATYGSDHSASCADHFRLKQQVVDGCSSGWRCLTVGDIKGAFVCFQDLRKCLPLQSSHRKTPSRAVDYCELHPAGIGVLMLMPNRHSTEH